MAIGTDPTDCFTSVLTHQPTRLTSPRVVPMLAHISFTTAAPMQCLAHTHTYSLGTFVFLFVGHHCAHLAFDTLKKEHRDMHHWRQVTTLSVCITSLMCVLIGYSVYATFWNTSTAVMLQLYPATKQLNFVKIVVCIYSIFTVPMNFFAGREMIISLFPRSPKVLNDRGELEQPLEWWLLAEGQLIGPFHFALSFMQWFFMTLAAILAPTLTDILNVGGCLTGSMIGYILPCLFYFKLKGFAKEPAFLFARVDRCHARA